MSVETIRLLLRITARISGSLFLLGFAGPALRVLWPSELARRLGLSPRQQSWGVRVALFGLRLSSFQIE
jgi:hypothetical protein